ncbi:MAG TPA: chemotaxis protein CheW [Anaerolineales bacterium]|nr:chemotaxis protein CheW [Anaerolineales bacterium]
MLDMDDAFIKEYLAESREHLADIETDLLTIESEGANIDEVLVNKVFRAAHSIKGGAGFFNLHTIQELAHRTENALDMIRSREMIPAPDVINVLLLAFDRLRDLLNDHETSHLSDISEILVALAGIVSANLEPAKKESLIRIVKVTAPGVKTVLNVPEFDFERAKDGKHYLYLIEYDLIDDIQRKGKRPLDVLYLLNNSGSIIEAVFELEGAGTLDDEPSNQLPFVILFSTELPPHMADVIFDLPANQVHVIYIPHTEVIAQPQIETQNSPMETLQAIPMDPAPVATPAIQPASQPIASSLNPEPPTQQNAMETTLRVDVSVLESLINLAGELVLSRNQLLDAMASGDQRTMQIGAQRINLVTSELQESIMLTRMQPISNIFNKFPRVVRDLSKELGKDIRLEISGREVEMDKTIIEGLNDPMTHMVRNAVDHGIETMDERIRDGKPAFGTIRLKAYHEAGQVVIEIRDDGRGIDPAKVAASAVAKGFITGEQMRAMSAKEMTALVFMPGFSTADKVSGLSGRGVGMDVVKTNLDKLGGKIEIDSAVGKGTTIIVRLPLTLAIIPSLLLSVNRERFAIPQVHVSELIHIPADQIKKRIEVVGNSEVLTLRGELIPLVRLSDIMGGEKHFLDSGTGQPNADHRASVADRRSSHYTLDDAQPIQTETDRQERQIRSANDRRYHASSHLNIVVITTGSLQYGLVVDQLHDTVEIVVKPLGRHFKGLREYAGATILGDGNVALILDAAGIALKTGLVSMAGSRHAQELSAETMREESMDRHSLLAFRNAPNEYCAIPMDLVVRILQVQNGQIEWAGGRRTMQYRNASLPLVTLRDTANVSDLQPDQEKVVVICKVFGHEVGLLAGMPVDVLETTAAIDNDTLRQKGVLGSAIIDGNTTLILDIFEIVAMAFPDWTVETESAAPLPSDTENLILLAEDSDFFRGQVRRYLESDGYNVLSAVDGQEAWEMLQANSSKVCLVLTDIEMPRLDGLGLTRNIRAEQRFKSLPIIALTSLASEEDTARGIAAGVNEYQVKLDREKLLEGIRNLLHLQPDRD